MKAKILDGAAIAAQIRNEIKNIVDGQKCKPKLAVVLCGENPASQVYVKKKLLACEEVGINCSVSFPAETYISQEIQELNQNKAVNGIIVQLPLPNSIDQYSIFDRIDPLKDVDVFNPVNVGLLVQGRPRFKPCTPAGIQELLTRSGIQISGKKVCIINRSDIVGKPLHSLLIQNFDDANATIAHCHDYTPHEKLKSICLQSDIIVVAVGKPNFLTADMVPVGAVVVDVGINRLPGSNKIVGDVDFEAVSEKASWISPVPNGCGPVTVACLLKNTLKAFNLQNKIVSGPTI